jgi:hypothetical protein
MTELSGLSGHAHLTLREWQYHAEYCKSHTHGRQMSSDSYTFLELACDIEILPFSAIFRMPTHCFT